MKQIQRSTEFSVDTLVNVNYIIGRDMTINYVSKIFPKLLFF